MAIEMTCQVTRLPRLRQELARARELAQRERTTSAVLRGAKSGARGPSRAGASAGKDASGVSEVAARLETLSAALLMVAEVTGVRPTCAHPWAACPHPRQPTHPAEAQRRRMCIIRCLSGLADSLRAHEACMLKGWGVLKAMVHAWGMRLHACMG